MRIELTRCTVRSWRRSDAPSVARHANNRKVWLHLRDRFPHPYSLEDAEAFIEAALKRTPETFFAIEVDGEAAGSIGFGLAAKANRFRFTNRFGMQLLFFGLGQHLYAIALGFGRLTHRGVELLLFAQSFLLLDLYVLLLAYDLNLDGLGLHFLVGDVFLQRVR